MPTVSEQNEFATNVAKLILKAQEMGYQVTLGDAYRDARLHGTFGEKKGYGAAKSFHKTRMAIDLNLFSYGRYLPSTEDHRALGAWWVSIGGTWGGNFKTPDGNHYSWGEGR
jgi:hypothetical protein